MQDCPVSDSKSENAGWCLLGNREVAAKTTSRKIGHSDRCLIFSVQYFLNLALSSFTNAKSRDQFGQPAGPGAQVISGMETITRLNGFGA
jgi:hypothetical protein